AAAPAAQTPSGPRAPLADPVLERLVSGNPAAEAAAAELAGLETRFKGAKRANGNEETGQTRDDVVAGLASLRAKVATLEPSLQPHFYRAMNAVSPYYYQKNNIILEFDRKDGTHAWNTCNITSLAMALEALGKTGADYKHKALLPPIAAVFKGEIDDRAKDKQGTELTGLRLPDFVAMAAIAWQMGYQTGDKDAILKGGNDAFNKIPSADAIRTLAKDFGVPAKYGEFKLDKTDAKDKGRSHLKSYGAGHWKRGDGLKEGALTEGTIEEDLPLERYKQAVLAEIRPHLDGGRQLAVAQHNHYVRLQAVTDEFIIKDDPGRFSHTGHRASWEEARALGLFQHWIAIG
ncbi:C39 family peptidase, partial [Solirubrobacter taibaiensis]|nr:C39 family peptidase [Solirubrobacter taibaiensis]